MVEESKDKEKRELPVSEGYLYFRNLLRTANSGHIETSLPEGKIVVCVADYYHSTGHPSTDLPPKDDLETAFTVLFGYHDSQLEELLRTPLGMFPEALQDFYGVTNRGVRFVASRGSVTLRTKLGDTISVNSKELDPNFNVINWDVEHFMVNDPEKSMGLAMKLANRVKEALG